MTGASIAQWQVFNSGKVRVRVSVGQQWFQFWYAQRLSAVVRTQGRSLINSMPTIIIWKKRRCSPRFFRHNKSKSGLRFRLYLFLYRQLLSFLSLVCEITIQDLILGGNDSQKICPYCKQSEMKSNLDYVRKKYNGKKPWFCNQIKSQEYAIVLNIWSLPMGLIQD